MQKNLLNDLFDTKPCLTEQEVRKYVQGTLSGKERFQVENHLLSCPLCSEAVEGYRFETTTAKFLEFSELKKKWTGSGIIGRGSRPNVVRWIMRIAALTLVILAAYWGFFRQENTSRLFNRYYTTYQLDIPVKMRGTQTTTELSPMLLKALQDYDSGQYEACLDAFQSVLLEDPTNNIAIFYKSLALLELGQVEAAIPGLKDVVERQGLYKDQAIWYLGLSYLKLGDKRMARSYLQTIVNGNHFKSKEATQLLKQLK